MEDYYNWEELTKEDLVKRRIILLEEILYIWASGRSTAPLSHSMVAHT